MVKKHICSSMCRNILLVLVDGLSQLWKQWKRELRLCVVQSDFQYYFYSGQ